MMFTFRNIQKSADINKGLFMFSGFGTSSAVATRLNDSNVLSTVSTGLNIKKYGSAGSLGTTMFFIGGDRAAYSSDGGGALGWNSNVITTFDGFVGAVSSAVITTSQATYECGTVQNSTNIYLTGGNTRTDSGNANTRVFSTSVQSFSVGFNCVNTGTYPVASGRHAGVNFGAAQMNLIGGTLAAGVATTFRNWSGSAFTTLSATLAFGRTDLPVTTQSSTQAWLLGAGASAVSINSWTSSGVQSSTGTNLSSTIYNLQGAAARNNISYLSAAGSLLEWDGASLSTNSNTIPVDAGYLLSVNIPPSIVNP